METYLVRIWRSALPDAPRDDVRGFVERVGDDEPQPFVGVEQLISLLVQTEAVAPERAGIQQGVR